MGAGEGPLIGPYTTGDAVVPEGVAGEVLVVEGAGAVATPGLYMGMGTGPLEGVTAAGVGYAAGAA